MSLAIIPAVWIAHFLGVYALVSIACANGATAIVVPGVALTTAAALALFAWLGARSFARLRSALPDARFLGSASLMLCMVCAVCTLWVAYPAFVLPSCAS